jgi:hypothetical protein
MRHLRLFHKVTWSRLISASMCLIALVVYWTVSPGLAKVQALVCGSCEYEGKSYSQGSCRSGQKCKCCADGGVEYACWDDDESCPC